MASGRVPEDTAFLAKVHSGREQAAADLKSAAAMPEWRVPPHHSPSDFESSSWLYNLSSGLSRDALTAVTAGNLPAALEVLDSIHRAAQRQMECGGSLIAYLCGIAVQSDAAELACGILASGRPNETQLSIMDKLWENEPAAAEGWKTALHWECDFYRMAMDHIASHGLSEERKESFAYFHPLLLKKNMTFNRYHQRMRRLIDVSFRVFPTSGAAQAAGLVETGESRTGWTRWLHPNASGRELANIDSIVRVAKGVPKALFVSRAMRVRFALHRWRQENPDHWPASLEDLIPKYLPSIPADPWTGKPLSWDESSRTIYAAGSDWELELPSFTKDSIQWVALDASSPGLRVELPGVKPRSP